MPITDGNYESSEATAVSENGWRPVGDGVNAAPWRSVCFTIHATDNAVDWRVFGAHASDYEDEVMVYPTEGNAVTVEADEADSYAASPAPYHYYRPKVKSATPNQHGTVTVTSMAKAN